MNLTLKEKQMLNGKQGNLIREAMKFLVSLGEAFNAEKMIDISYANVLLASGFWGRGPLTNELVEEAVKEGVRVKIPTTFNNWGCGSLFSPDSIWETLEVSNSTREQILRENVIAKRLGIVPTCTCAPYLVCDTGWYPFGTHISTVESSAIVYFNSVLSARSNRDCISSFYSAITGKYPAFGFHLDENRYGSYHFDIQTEVENSLDYGLLGIYAGKISGVETPVFTGLGRPRSEALVELSAALASSGTVTMFHIVGVTPEALNLEIACGGKKPIKKIIVTKDTLVETHQHLSDREGKLDFVCLGCPHYSIYEMKKVSEILNGKSIQKDVTLWICTSPQTAMFAEMAGYADIIRKAGGTIMSGPNFCPLFGPGKPGPEYAFAHPNYSVGSFATDAAKQAYYAKANLRAEKVFLGSTEKCIDAAVEGEWRTNQ
ncbi:aconitase X [Chloroflexota bacterium]